MKLLERRLGRLPNYIKAFGVAEGIRLLLANEKAWPRDGSRVDPLRVPGYAHSMLLRDSVSDHATFWQCIVRSQYSTAHLPQSARLDERYRREVKAGRQPLIVDCGGNIGLSAIWYATRYPAARIVVVEPDRENFELMERNLAPFGDRIVKLRGGVWNARTRLSIVDPSAGKSAIRVDAAGAAQVDAADTLEAYTLDDICQLAGETHPLIVKMDIEGAQKTVFTGDPAWIARTSMICLELDDWLFPWGGTSTAFFRATSRFDFDYLMSGESIFLFNHALAAGQGG